MTRAQSLGQDAESFVCDYLTEKKFQILKRNWRVKRGEIDIIALDGNEWVCVEVKALSDASDFDPMDHVTPKKIQTLIALSQQFMAQQIEQRNMRIDIVLVYCQSTPWRVDHFKDAVQS